MNELVILFAVSFFTGITVKITDLIEDEGLRLFKYANISFGVIYGILMSYVIVNYSHVSALFLGTITAMIFAGKIDSMSHAIGVIIAYFSIVFFGAGSFSFFLFLLFLFFAFIDEKLNDFLDKRKFNFKSFFLQRIIEARPVLELTAFFVSLFTGIYVLFFALLFFDLGYILVDRLF